MKTKEQLFKALISKYRHAADDSERERIHLEMWDTFGEKRATLITDMSDFTYISHQYGSVHYLSMISRMEEIVTSVITAHEGTLVKCEADNTFSIFHDPSQALLASQAINTALKKENAQEDEKFHIRIACGIAYGTILVLDEDIYGQSVIIASKLGEDIAKGGEILVSQATIDAIADNDIPIKEHATLNISKVEVTYCSL